MSDDLFINPSDWRVEIWPPTPKTGVITGNMSNGVRVTHLPTGLVEIETEGKHMHINKKTAVGRILNAITAAKEQSPQK